MLKANASFGSDVLQLRDGTASALRGLASWRRGRRCGMALLATHKIRGHEDQEQHPYAMPILISVQSFSFKPVLATEFSCDPSSPALHGLHSGLLTLLRFQLFVYL